MDGIGCTGGGGKRGKRTHEGGLGDTGCNEQRNTGTNAPLADKFVQQEHKVRTGKQLGHDNKVRPSKTVGIDEPLTGVKEPIGLGNGFNWNHNKNKEFLNTLVHGFVF